jgi:dolichol-phosphate mannosyltransferase
LNGRSRSILSTVCFAERMYFYSGEKYEIFLLSTIVRFLEFIFIFKKYFSTMKCKFAVIVPMANEENEFQPFIKALEKVLDNLECGKVYLVVDTASKDRTLELCTNLSAQDERFVTIWAPENENVVDAYLRGYREALKDENGIIIEMDAGLSHDPQALPMFLRVLNEGNECAFGSRFINGGSIFDSKWQRTFLSRIGTLLANILLGTKMYDMTSGFQGFHSSIVKNFVDYPLLSRAHFYQTELRYLLRYTRYAEIPVHYRAPSPSVSKKAIANSLSVLWHYFLLRLQCKAAYIK